VSLRAFLRTFLQNEQISQSKAMQDFLTARPIKLNEEELGDIQRRKEMDEKRIEEQKQFYEIARQRAKELDVYMEKFRRDIVERSTTPYSYQSTMRLIRNADGLTNLFKEIKEKEKIDGLTIEYKKFAEWLRIE
jgi:ABC-type Fe3+-hydroxamate transport system substrate-binding protein